MPFPMLPMFSGLVIAAALASGASGPSVITPGDRAAESLRLLDWRVQRVEGVYDERSAEVTLAIELAGEPRTVTLRPSSVRGDGFRVLVGDGAGGLVDAPVPQGRTFRGVTDAGGVVAASRGADGGWSLLIEERGRRFAAEPLSRFEPGAMAQDVIVYDAGDVVDDGHFCGADPLDVPADVAPRGEAARSGVVSRRGAEAPEGAGAPDAATAGGLAAGQFYIAELGVDCDFSFFSRNGLTVGSTVAEVERLVNAVNVVYERDVAVSLRISGVVVRASAAENPYTGNVGGALLSQMRGVWAGGATGIPHDAAHLFSGVDFDGGVIGVAYVSTVCTGSRYGVNDLRFTTSLASKTALISHELGHNFSASHCDDAAECRIMCSGINGCGGYGAPNFAPVSVASITAHAASRTCLDIGGGQVLPLPVVERVAGGLLDPQIWVTTAGVGTSDETPPPPSAPFALVLDGVDALELRPVDATAGVGEQLVASLAYRAAGVDQGESLLLEYYNRPDGSGGWVELARVDAPAGGMGRYLWVDAPLPVAAAFSGLRLRMRSVADAPDDRWLIDDVRVGPLVARHAPFEEAFESSLDVTLLWDTVLLAGLEPFGGVGGRAARLDSASTLLTRRLDLRFLDAADRLWAIVRPTDAGAGVLRLEVRNVFGGWVGVVEVDAASSTGAALVQGVVPFGLWSDDAAVRAVVEGAAPGSAWLVDAVGLGPVPAFDACPADVAAPQGVLDVNDVIEFVNAASASGAAADIAPAFGVVDVNDVLAFVASFQAGCP